MIILPAIDILDGKVVRLSQGNYSRVTVYGDDPFAQAMSFAEQGATWVHVVDLDGAQTGHPKNITVIEKIAAQSGLNVEVGGGIRTLGTLEVYADAGAKRMVLGTALIKDPSFAREATSLYGDQVVAGIDARDGEVAVEGWREGSGYPVSVLARDLARMSVKNIIYTDIARDGMQTGIDASFYKNLAAETGMNVTASGGISTLDDLRALAQTGAVWGAICGRSIYEKSFTVAEALAAVQAEEG